MCDSTVRAKLRVCVSILEKWDCSPQQIKRLLGIRFPKTLDGVLDGTCSLTEPMELRADCIINIDRILGETFEQFPILRYAFVNRKNDDCVFKHQTPLQFMSRGIKALQKTSDRLNELNLKRREEYVKKAS